MKSYVQNNLLACVSTDIYINLSSEITSFTGSAYCLYFRWEVPAVRSQYMQEGFCCIARSTVQRKILAGENFGKLQAKLHLAKKTLADLTPASIVFSDITSNWHIKLNLLQIAKFTKVFPCQNFPLYSTYCIYLVKCCGVNYPSSTNQCGAYSNLITIHCSKTVFTLGFCTCWYAYSIHCGVLQ